MAASAADAANRQLVFTRVFDAPRELVHEAWTDPRHVGGWWTKGFRMPLSAMELRRGGGWRSIMHGPDGMDYRNRIVFLD